MPRFDNVEIFSRLVGQVIESVVLVGDDDLTITTDTQVHKYSCEGDCCAHAYFIDPDQDIVADIVGEAVLSAVEAETQYDPHEDYGDVTDITFYTIKSMNTDLSIELRVNHNGYYGGTVYHISSEDKAQ